MKQEFSNCMNQRSLTEQLIGGIKMDSSENKPLDDQEKIDDERSLKNAMYNSILFVGGGLVFFWLLLFLTYTRG